ncbi:glutamyl-tRNA reductase [Candidatus Persebacteraceae bacterium Df01]|uniref:Glutamyl-tRNA reductase n=1 Tax=Candidatus Doriopsillibacter californiensis TaxID=2970740 RepID=A0ABT7QLE5_9GAMM|nr:glutamyl-tRNA reductase [Candidatus Persebacteraceae bacterium Df01]
MSQLFSIGADHRMASQAVREMLSISTEAVADKLRQLRAKQYVQEAAIVSTCNRTEIYCLTDQPAQVAHWLAGDHSGALFQLCARDAVRRAFCVASGIESQIIGEPEITGQIKRAADIARKNGDSGVIINRLLEKALSAAKAVRQETDIGRRPLSYCGLVAQAAAGIFPNLTDVAALFVGTGDMSRAGMKMFAARGVRRLAVASRNAEKAAMVAQTANGEGIAISRLPGILNEFDIVVSATASQVPIIGKGAVEQALLKRRHRPMIFADLGVPRDLESEIDKLPDAFVYTLDQLGEQAARSQVAREEAAKTAESIITRHVTDFCNWLQQRTQAPAVRAVRESAESAREREAQAAIARLQRGEDPQTVINDFSRRLTNKILHHPTILLNQQVDDKADD